jgi:uncharacterized membrane protein
MREALELPRGRGRRYALLGLSLLFVVAGSNHFLDPAFYLTMMPPYLPAHRPLVALSGVIELIGGLAVLVPKVRSGAGWGLVLLLVAIFPANVHMALNPDVFPELPVAALYARLPLQGLLMAWAFWATRPEDR